MSNFADKMLEAYNRPPDRPPFFQVGQVVRVRKRVVKDGQTPLYWKGAKAVVVRHRVRGLFTKAHYYTVRHAENGKTCEFRESELRLPKEN